MNRTRKGRGLWKLFTENTNTFSNVTFGMIPDSVDQMLAGMLLAYLLNRSYIDELVVEFHTTSGKLKGNLSVDHS